MFLSLVVAGNAPFAPLVKDSDRQRFNVATSRARDQVFLFHSVKLDSIRNPECVRYRLLEWYKNPPLAEMEYGIEILKRKAESEFEINVGERIIKKGYKVVPQFRPLPNDFNYRIDLVVQGDKKLVGIECDGEKYHGPDRWEYDQRREAQLRRAGWKFWRISGSAFYRDKDGAMENLWNFLKNEGITPETVSEEGSEGKEKIFPSGTERKPDAFITAAQDGKPFEKNDYEGSGNGRHSEAIQPSKEVREDIFHAKNKNGSIRSDDRLGQVKEFLDLYNNWKIWQKLISWGESTDYIDSFSRAICYQIVERLKLGRKINPWLTKEMERIWKTAIKKGFKAELTQFE